MMHFLFSALISILMSEDVYPGVYQVGQFLLISCYDIDIISKYYVCHR